MDKISDAKKREKSRMTEQDESRCAVESSDAKRAEGGVESTGHEKKKKKKRKRKHESSSIADEFASAGDISRVVVADVNAESKRDGRKNRKLELNNDSMEELEKPRKDRKRKHGDNGDVGSDPEGLNSKKKKKKLKLDLGVDELEVMGAQEMIENSKKKKEDSKQGECEVRTDQLDSGYEDNKKKKKEKEKKRKKKEKEKEKEKEKGKEKKREKEKKSKKDEPARESARKVRFADEVEFFPSLDGLSEENGELVRGKRFTLEEDELIKKAVHSFIEDHGLGEDGLDMVLHCKEHSEIRNCWKEIGAALPWRPYSSVYYRAHILFERSETRSWTDEEREFVKKFHAEHGSDWRTVADAMGKHRFHVKDLWRRIKLDNLKKGHWSQEEYQTLFDLVNKDLQMNALEEKVSNYRILRDNICWEAISQKLSTRLNSDCCSKWYHQLSSPMVAEGVWADADDYRLLNALVDVDACSMEEVDWDCLVENRPGSLCRKRWAQMIRHIGEHGKKSFVQQVEILSERYCPDLVEVRDAVDKKRLED